MDITRKEIKTLPEGRLSPSSLQLSRAFQIEDQSTSVWTFFSHFCLFDLSHSWPSKGRKNCKSGSFKPHLARIALQMSIPSTARAVAIAEQMPNMWCEHLRGIPSSLFSALIWGFHLLMSTRHANSFYLGEVHGHGTRRKTIWMVEGTQTCFKHFNIAPEGSNWRCIFFKWWKEGSKFSYKYSMSVRYQGLLYLGAGSWTYLMFSLDIAK